MTHNFAFPSPVPVVKTVGLLLLAAVAAGPAAAEDIRFVLHAEPAAAFWVDQPQSDRFTPGFYGAIRPGIALGRVVSLQWSYAYLGVPAAEGYTESGGAHFLLAGVRFRPFAMLRPEEEQLGGLFGDVDVGYVRTGEFDRFGFDTGLGYAFQVAPGFALGPVARYSVIVQPEHLTGADLDDAQFVSVGLNLSFGGPSRGDEEPVPAECPDVVALPAAPPLVVVEACPDGDRDGVCDADDRCPTAPGPAAALGCPLDPCGGTPLVVLVQFPYDSARLPSSQDDVGQSMDPILDAVAAAIAQDRTCRVCVIGHASEEGAPDYNLRLSDERAAAVSGYLVRRGLKRADLPSTGFGEACTLTPEVGHALNRRVEFRRLDEGESCPTTCSE